MPFCLSSLGETDMKFSQYLFSFLMGYFLYSLVEIVGRGYTHWTMSLTGGIILAALYSINSLRSLTLWKSCFIGALLITAVEFAVGIFDNIIMHWEVWDYSDLPLNFMGQICLFFSLYWYILCIPAYYLCRSIRKRFE
ncbi:MAG: hypothetical protein IIY35_07405 [Ruminococcus sp.]|nr:hypothetical protein [Ruminococcus sp.]